MSQYKSQIQNLFLSTVRKKHIPVEVVMNTGTSLRGKVKGYDQFSITLTFKGKVEVVYKSAILFISALARPQFSRPPRGPARSTREPPRDAARPRPPVRRRPDSEPEHDPPPPRKMIIK